MELYAGFDLHSNNNYLAVMNKDGARVFSRKLPNDPAVILEVLQPFQGSIEGAVVESTYNWYWLVDLLRDNGCRVHLANPAAIQRYKGLKHCNDRNDAFWLAQLLRLGILPSGYIYPREDRPVRDLLRKRSHLVKLRTSLILSLQNILKRNSNVRISTNAITCLTQDKVAPYFQDNEDLALAGSVSKDMIDALTEKIRLIENAVEGKARLKEPCTFLKTIPGVGKILALTIMLETGPIIRFPSVGNYVSYCRKVNSSWTSNEKQKGKGNRKNGNKYLAWAFSEAAVIARWHYPYVKSYYDRKARKTNIMTAHSAVAHKLARAAYIIMRDQVPFEPEKLFM